MSLTSTAVPVDNVDGRATLSSTVDSVVGTTSNVTGPPEEERDALIVAAAKDQLVATVPFFEETKALRNFESDWYLKFVAAASSNIAFDDINWHEDLSIIFPVVDGRGSRPVPLCLLLDAPNIDGKLIVLNWWRHLTLDEQDDYLEILQDFYRAPLRSNIRKQLSSEKEKRDASSLSVDNDSTKATESDGAVQDVSHEINESTVNVHTDDIETSVTTPDDTSDSEGKDEQATIVVPVANSLDQAGDGEQESINQATTMKATTMNCSSTMNDNESVKKRKEYTVKAKKPMGIPTARLPHFQKIAEDLGTSVPFFRDHTKIGNLEQMFYIEIPETVDWGSASNLAQSFPNIRGKGKFVIPLALIFETDSAEGKLVVVNYWRALDQEEQKALRDVMRFYYLRPSLSNERVHLDSATKAIAIKDGVQRDANGSSTSKVVKITATVPTGYSGVVTKDMVRFADAVESLSRRVRFFTEIAPLAGIEIIHYTEVPANLDWNDPNAVHEAYPPLKNCAPRQVPLCLILEASSDEEKLVVVNWWRYLNTLQQPQVFQELRRFYRAPTRSKDLMRDFQTVDDKRKLREALPVWGFRCMGSSQELADKLKLSCDQLYTANIEDNLQCKTEGCVYPAMCQNSGYCCRHRISFAPLSGKERGRRGYLLLGPTYTKPNGRQCSCDDEICVSIGYSHSMTRFDVSRLPEDLQADVWKKVMPESRKSACLAPWHFHPIHRVFLPDGSWKILEHRRTTTFKDPSTGKDWIGLPPPTYSLKDFLEEPEMIEYKSRKATNLLPSWVRQYQKLEEGPLSPAEQQTNELWKQIDDYHAKLTTQALLFETKHFALEKDMEELQGKYDEKKHLKRRDKKRRKSKRARASTNKSPSNKKSKTGGGENNQEDDDDDEDEEEEPAAVAAAADAVCRDEHETRAGLGGHAPGTQFGPVDTYGQYYQDRVRYAGGWPATGVRRFF
jgi:hypothetical protein